MIQDIKTGLQSGSIPPAHIDNAAYRALGEIQDLFPASDLNNIIGGLRPVIQRLAPAFHLVDGKLPAVGPDDLPGLHEAGLIDRGQDVGGKVILPSLGKDFFASVGKQFFT